jgi:hypothetical protein
MGAAGAGLNTAPPSGADAPRRAAAGFGPTLALTVTLAAAVFLIAMPLALLVVHPGGSGLVRSLIGQSQSAKTWLYVGTYGVILPVSLIVASRVAGAIASGPNREALSVLCAVLVATLAATVTLVRLSAGLPWEDGLGTLLAGIGAWSVLAAAAVARAASSSAWVSLQRLAHVRAAAWMFAGASVLCATLCVTHIASLGPLALAVGATALAAVVVAYGRVRLPRIEGWHGAGLDLLAVGVLLLAVPNVVVFKSAQGLPSMYFEPGVVQFQQDWILGPVNQLLAGGALLVNDPSSQYGVGLVYFLAGWFHLAPIGYGTLGLLDGILTALFYIAAYVTLRVAGVSRLLATTALAFAVVVLIYNLHFPVGQLPEQGPLRFGMPMAVLLAAVGAARGTARGWAWRVATYVIVGLASVWALEAFAYTAFTFVAVTAVAAWLRPPGTRARWCARELTLAGAACVGAQLILAAATLAGTGGLLDWSQYLTYVHGLLLGGREGSTTFGFERWSPGLAMGAVCLASAAAIVLLIRCLPALARSERVKLIALTGATAYAIATFSYTDNRSSTYLLLYVALPVVMVAALWLEMLLRSRWPITARGRLGGVAFAGAIAVVMLAAAWPSVGSRFSQSALAHAYPGGGLRAAMHRLWHPPPIDPRAPEGEWLLKRYVPGKRVVIVLPDSPDLAIEILIRARRANALFIGDPIEDSFVPSVWMPRVARQIAELAPGRHVLVDAAALRIATALRGRGDGYPFEHPVGRGNPQLEWVLHRIDERFRLRPIAEDSQGFVVAELVPRD